MEQPGRNTNILLALMVLLHSLWLVMKGTLGVEASQSNAWYVLAFCLLAGTLLIGFPYFKQNFFPVTDRILSSLKQRLRDTPHTLAGFLLLGFFLIDLVWITFVKEGQYDENNFQDAVRIYTEEGWRYFFAHYGEIPWLGRQHPPLPIIVVGHLTPVFGGDPFLTSRVVTSLLGLGTAYFTYLIAGKLYNRRVALFSMLFLFGIRQFYLLNIVSGNDMFVTFFFTLTVWSLLKLNPFKEVVVGKKLAWAAIAGVVISFGMLSKYTMLLAYLLLPALLLWPFSGRFPAVTPDPAISMRLKSGMPLLLGVVLFSFPLLILWLQHSYQLGFLQQNVATISDYVGTEVAISADSTHIAVDNYFTAWRLKFFLNALLRRIPIALGVYSLPFIALGVWRWIKNEKRSGYYLWSNRLVAYWIAIIFIPVLIALPVDRYFMPAFPALAILMACGLNSKLLRPYRILLLALIFSISSLALYLG